MEQNTNRLLWAVGLLALGALLLGGGIVLAQENFLPKISQAFVKMIDGPGYSDEEIDDLIKKGFIPIATAEELNNVRNATVETYGKGTKWEDKYLGGLDKKYVQVKDIDLSVYSKEGWAPSGTDPASFRGTYDGGNYVITDLEVKGEGKDYQGLFGYAYGATIGNVALKDVNVTGEGKVGGLVGSADSFTKISNSYATGAVIGSVDSVGGLVGQAGFSTIETSYTEGSVSGTGNYVGGLVGGTYSAYIKNSYATGEVTGTDSVGGLVGCSQNYTDISNSYATGEVTGTESVGGLVGEAFTANGRSVVSNSYATGSVTGNKSVGGLVGDASYGNMIINSYATGAVIGSSYVGGLVGWTGVRATISNSYATGEVTGTKNVGGLVGGLSLAPHQTPIGIKKLRSKLHPLEEGKAS